MTALVAFLRGVNLGKRTVKSAQLVEAFGALGFAGARTLIASGNVLFDGKPSAKLAAKIEAGLAAQFGFAIDVILRTQAELQTIVASAPFARVAAHADSRPHVVLFAGARPRDELRGVPGDYDLIRADERELYLVAWRQPQGGLGREVTKLLARLNKQSVSTARAWTTICKAAG